MARFKTDFNDTLPAADAGFTNLHFQGEDPATIPDGGVRHVSFSAPDADAGVKGLIAMPDPLDASKVLKGDGTWGAAGGALARSQVQVVTAALAQSVAEVGSVNIGKRYDLLKVEVSSKARVQLYYTAAARDADVRNPDVNGDIALPAAGTEHQIVCDLYLDNAANLVWYLSEVGRGQNGDTPTTAAAYFRITNLDAAAQAVTVTLTVLVLEA